VASKKYLILNKEYGFLKRVSSELVLDAIGKSELTKCAGGGDDAVVRPLACILGAVRPHTGAPSAAPALRPLARVHRAIGKLTDALSVWAATSHGAYILPTTTTPRVVASKQRLAMVRGVAPAETPIASRGSSVLPATFPHFSPPKAPHHSASAHATIEHTATGDEAEVVESQCSRAMGCTPDEAAFKDGAL